MKVALKWLKDYVDVRDTPKELAEKLTMAGLEVKGMQIVGGDWHDVVVGEVVALDPHPNASHLKLATVDLGSRQATVVCGAPNIGLHQKVLFAQVGARLIDGHTGKAVSLRTAKIRGVVSEGMVCSEKELGISNNHEGIMILPPEASVGTPLNDYLGDVVFDLDITPNRPDCLSVIGIAREAAALTGQKPQLPEIRYKDGETPINSCVTVDIVEPRLCPRYCASLIEGVKIGPSPGWLQQRLSSCGLRPINNVVDVTNYVMLEYGQPLHAFDYHKIEGNQVIVRRAKNGEIITTLDGTKRLLSPNTLVIADKKKPIAVAGIMGGLGTEVMNETHAILLESANFNQAVIRQGCRYLGLQSEASVRFDKGLNPALPMLPLKRATQLLLEMAGGKAAKGIIDVYPSKSQPKPVVVSTGQVKRISGMDVDIGEITRVLTLLGFECQHTDSSLQISVVPPDWRSDIRYPVDIVEEVVRIIGYDKIPVTRLSAPLPPHELAPAFSFKRKIQNALAGWGFQEVLTYSLTSLEKLQKLSPALELKLSPLKVANPMTKEQEYLRTTLRAGLLSTLSHNQKFEQAGIRLFEIGKIFLPQGSDLPHEKEMLCAVLSGPKWELSWHSKEVLDFFDAKGIVESLLNQAGLRASFEVSDDESLLPGRAANVIIDNDSIGVVGDLHPKIAQVFDLSGVACLLEIDLEKLSTRVGDVKKYQLISRFPSMSKDIALVVDEQVTYKEVEKTVESFPLVKQVMLFDLYRGKQIPQGKKSFALRIVYQSSDRTLTDEEVNRTQEQILDALNRKLSASLRS